MSKFTALVLALALGQAFAAPSDSTSFIERRQTENAAAKGGKAKGGKSTGSGGAGGLGALGALAGLFGGGSGSGSVAPLLKAAALGNLGHFMGEPEAGDAVIALAKTMGANKNSAGNLKQFNIMTNNPGYGPVPDPPGAAPKRVVLQSKIPGAQKVKLRYGPYSVPNMKKKNGMGLEGMLSNYPDDKIPKPCDGDCTILAMQAGLEYPNGDNANINTGMWLHHVVLFVKGSGRVDDTCAHMDVSVPHASVGTTPRNSERFFASGNERSAFNLPAWGIKDTGIKLRKEDSFKGLIELMNMNMEDKVVYFTMEYDFVPGHPYKDNTKMLWFDVRNCGTSEFNPVKGVQQFTLWHNWTATIDADVLAGIGHGHDGLMATNMLVNGKLICNNPAKYGTTPEFVQDPKNVHGVHATGATKHISDMKTCYGDSLGEKQMKKGQVWQSKSDYDFGVNLGMKHDDGSWDEVMGMEFLYVRVKSG